MDAARPIMRSLTARQVPITREALEWMVTAPPEPEHYDRALEALERHWYDVLSAG
jgi:hypothetical protein